MRLGLRIFLVYFLFVGLTAYFVLNTVREQVRPAVRQSTEETLVDTANLLAEILRSQVKAGTLAQSDLPQLLQAYGQRRPNADIWGLSKTEVNHRIYVTDARGVVLLDSAGEAVGQDYSRWNDVYLTLRGQYGARSTRSEVFAHNQAALAKDAPTVKVVELETSPFYQHFRQTPYFAQYRAAVEGNGGVARNYSAASDVLRYPVINYHGGLYLDVDDTLTEAWANAGLRVAPGELLLNEPVSNSVLGLDIGFNTSCFGSHAGNPLLDAISARSHERWLAAPDLFSEPRPVFQGSGDQRFGDYMKRISHVTGPGMLNDVLAEHSPALVRVRTVSRLLGSSVLIPEPLIRSIKRLVKMTCPLRDVVRIGADHSWRTTR